MSEKEIAKLGESSEPAWATTPPTEAGWYWCKTDEGSQVVQVVLSQDPFDTNDKGSLEAIWSGYETQYPITSIKGLWWPEAIREPK